MKRLATPLLILFAVLCAQLAQQQHSLSHALNDLAKAAQKDGVPPLDHKVSKCVAYQAIGSALTASSSSAQLEVPTLEKQVLYVLPRGAFTRTAFDSRAPPVLS